MPPVASAARNTRLNAGRSGFRFGDRDEVMRQARSRGA
jgi:hypothetical protein